jgi:DUF1365 family protein
VVIAPAIYTGTLRHRRFHPARHAFTYPLFMSLLDIDRIEESMRVSPWTSFNRFNWAAFDDRDHLPDYDGVLRQRLGACATAHGRSLPDGPIYLLTHLRYAGYVFNPISIYYCHNRVGELSQVMADVRNTYGGRRQYWLEPDDVAPARFRSTVAKTLFVSPFMHGEMQYEFILTPPAARLVVHMNVDERGGPRRRCFNATLTLSARPWTASSIRSTLVRYPFMTAGVIGAIHWEALRLRWKRFPEHNPVSAS